MCGNPQIYEEEENKEDDYIWLICKDCGESFIGPEGDNICETCFYKQITY